MQKHLPGQNASSGKAHHRNIFRIDAVKIRVFADETHRSGQVQRSLLLGIGAQAVIYNKRLIP